MARVTLRVLDGAERGKSFEKLQPPITIGRENGNSIQLNDDRVSRYHLKIQEDQNSVVLTDLDSTNGTRVNGEDIRLRILRVGDMISIGRSVLIYGSREEIANHYANMQCREPHPTGSIGSGESSSGVNLAYSVDSEAQWQESMEAQAIFHASVRPDIPSRLSPLQTAQLCELLEYVYFRIRELSASVKTDDKNSRISLEFARWQAILELQSSLAEYIREISDPPNDA